MEVLLNNANNSIGSAMEFIMPLKDWVALSSFQERQRILGASASDQSPSTAATGPDTIKEARIQRISIATSTANLLAKRISRSGDIESLLRTLMQSSGKIQSEDISVENFVVHFSMDHNLSSNAISNVKGVFVSAAQIIEACSSQEIEQILQSCTHRVDFVSAELQSKCTFRPEEQLTGDFFHKLGIVFRHLFLPGSDLEIDNSETEIHENGNGNGNENPHRDDSSTSMHPNNINENNVNKEEKQSGSEEGGRTCKNIKRSKLSNVEMELQQNSIPISICRLIADLINAGTDEVAEDDHKTTFHSLQDVTSELEQILSEPTIFLREEYTIPKEPVFSQNRIFGRDVELVELTQAIRNAPIDSLTNINNIFLIGGDKGSGKSHLLHMVRGAFSPDLGACLYCKFDQLARSQPLSTLSSAFNEFFQRIYNVREELEESEEVNSLEYEAIRTLLSSIERLLTAPGLVYLSELIPVFRSLYPDLFRRVVLDEDDSISSDVVINGGVNNNIGNAGGSKDDENDTDDLLGADNSRNRIHYLFRRLIQGLSSPTRPLYLFIDDLQWADQSSLSLITSMLTEFDHLQQHDNGIDDNSQGFMIAASYRNDDLDESIANFIDDLEHVFDGFRFNRIILTGLQAPMINAMISDALKLPMRLTRNLARELYKKTLGGPLFVKTLVSTLVEEDVLRFSVAKRRWTWDLNQVQDASIGNDVAVIIKRKLARVSNDVQNAVAVMSCFGQSVSESLVYLLSDEEEFIDFNVELHEAIFAGIIQHRGAQFYFPHDVVLQCAYELCDEVEALHFKIGVALMNGSQRRDEFTPDDPQLNSTTFEAIQQFIRAADVEVIDSDLKRTLTVLMIKASTFAVDVADFSCAKKYLDQARIYLGDRSWDENFDLTLRMHQNELYLCYLNASPARGEECYAEIMEHTTTLEQRLFSHQIRVRSFAANGELNMAIDTAFEILAQLGETFPSKITPQIIQSSLTSTIALMDVELFCEERIVLAPRISEERHWSMRIMDSILTSIYLARPSYLPLIAARMMQISIHHGLCQESSLGLCALGTCIAMLLQDTHKAHKVARLALCVVERFNATKIKPRVEYILNGFVNIWVQPLQATSNALKESRCKALLTGDRETAITTHGLSSFHDMMIGKPLHLLENEFAVKCREMVQFNQTQFLPGHTIRRKTVCLLAGITKDPFLELKLPVKNSDELLQYALTSGLSNLVENIYFNNMFVSYYMNQFDVVAEMAKKHQALSKQNYRLQEVYCFFYQGLTACKLSRSVGDSTWLSVGEKSVSQFQKWVQSSTWNFENKLLLLQAELHFSRGKHMEVNEKNDASIEYEAAVESYKAAIQSSRKHQFVHEEGLSNELFGAFYKARGNGDLEHQYMTEAVECYKKWGAHGVLRDSRFDGFRGK